MSLEAALGAEIQVPTLEGKVTPDDSQQVCRAARNLESAAKA